MLTAKKIQDISSSLEVYHNENYELEVTGENIKASIVFMQKLGYTDKEIKRHWDKILNG
jgi:hypothetical protein